MELKERIEKLRDELYGIYVDYLSDTKGGKREIDTAILNFIEEQVAEAVKAERKRMLKKIWKIGEGVDTEAVIEEVNTWCCEIEF